MVLKVDGSDFIVFCASMETFEYLRSKLHETSFVVAKVEVIFKMMIKNFKISVY